MTPVIIKVDVVIPTAGMVIKDEVTTLRREWQSVDMPLAEEELAWPNSDVVLTVKKVQHQIFPGAQNEIIVFVYQVRGPAILQRLISIGFEVVND